ncbi:MAG: hypothetical protein J0H98_04485 [Solirubrobacterales bacterium]|nr:hypothetical protein [Solirubrobacterales bacterium]
MTRTAITWLLSLAFAALAFASTANAAGTVTLEGYVWGASLGDGGAITAHRGDGATVYIAEHPDLRTTAAADGYWKLEVPDRESVTPCADYEGHHPTCDQTFFTRGSDLNQVNFQMVDHQIAGILGVLSGAAMVDGPDGGPRVKECAIVSTFYEKEKRSFFDFQDFLDAAPHGVAGATAVATSETGAVLPGPIYYNESVMPDRSYDMSSRDGGVMWVDIPPGVYTITSSHPTARFAPFRATCRDGRLINASPPWGLYEMARTEEPNPAVLPPDPDRAVAGAVVASRVVKSGKRRLLEVTVKAGEKLRARVEARQGRRRAARSKASTGRFTVRLPLGRGFRGGSLQAKTTLIDSAGNRVSSRARLAVPAPGASSHRRR